MDEGAALRAWRKGHQAASKRQAELLTEEGPQPEQAVVEGLEAYEALSVGERTGVSTDLVAEEGVKQLRKLWVRIERRARAQYKG